MKKAVTAKNGPMPGSSFSAALLVDDMLYLSGMIPIVPETDELQEGGIKEQTERAMKNIKLFLEEAGMDYSNIIKTTLYLKNMDDFGEMDQVYGAFFKGMIPPVRSTVQIAALPLDALIEIEAVAKK